MNMRKFLFLLLSIATTMNAQTFTDNCYDSSMEISRPENPTASPSGPYYPDETIQFCHTIAFYSYSQLPPVGNNCQWISGIVPTLNENWELVSPHDSGPSSSKWLEDGALDYNMENKNYIVETLQNGAIQLTYDEGNGNVQNGTLLPKGWWFSSNGGNGCINDGDLDNMWGLPTGCGTIRTIQFCFKAKVKSLQELVNCENAVAKLTMFAFADGETGCWANGSCGHDTPYSFEAKLDCNSILLNNTTVSLDKVGIYPTLFSNQLNINLPPSDHEVEISILNYFGQEIYTKSATNAKLEIPTINWANGEYNVILKSKNSSKIRKIVKN